MSPNFSFKRDRTVLVVGCICTHLHLIKRIALPRGDDRRARSFDTAVKGEENLLPVEQCTAVNSRRLCATAESRVMYVKCKDAFTADARARARSSRENLQHRSLRSARVCIYGFCLHWRTIVTLLHVFKIRALDRRICFAD